MHSLRGSAPKLAWVLPILLLLVAVPEVYLATANGETSLADNLLTIAILLVFAGLGALIASRHPRNPIGWIFAAVALISLSGELGIEYAVYGLVQHPGSLPAAIWLAIYGGICRATGWFYMMTLVPLYFPTGKLLSARWRWVPRMVVAATTLLMCGDLFGQTGSPIDDRLVHVRNPLAFLPGDLGVMLTAFAFLIFLLILIVSSASVVIRFRRTRGIERQQLKWFVYAVAVGVAFSLFFGVAVTFSLNASLVGSIWYLAALGMPIAAAISILRYRLYEIDLIINRTLVYGSLTALLAGVYFGSVVLLQQVARAVTGQRGESALAIVVSTLLIAALFQPLRVRLQRLIDRRFYRQKYDAAKTLAQFAATLRGEVDIADLEQHLVGVVEETMRPAHVSVWLRPSDQPTRNGR